MGIIKGLKKSAIIIKKSTSNFQSLYVVERFVMLYSEFIELTGFEFISSEIYHDEIENAYCNYVGNKKEFCKILTNISDSPVLFDGFLSSLLWGYEGIDYTSVFYTVSGYVDDMKIERTTHFYTQSAALIAKKLLERVYSNFTFTIK